MLFSLPASRRGLSMAMAQASKAPRAYFYFVDTHGRLYLHDTTPRTIATCLKDSKFLDFFWKRLQLNTNELVSSSAFPYVSPCGSEMNFVQCADTPWVHVPLVFCNFYFGLCRWSFVLMQLNAESCSTLCMLVVIYFTPAPSSTRFSRRPCFPSMADCIILHHQLELAIMRCYQTLSLCSSCRCDHDFLSPCVHHLTPFSFWTLNHMPLLLFIFEVS